MLQYEPFEVTESLEIKSKKPVKLLPLSDIHIGGKTFNEQFFETTYDDVLKKLKNLWIIGLGDYIDFAHKRKRHNGVYEQKLHAQQQKSYTTDLIYEIRRKMLGLHGGNHEDTAMELGLNIVEDMAKYCKIPMLADTCNLDITVGDKTWNIVSTHGTTNAKYLHTAMSAVDRDMGLQQFDLCLYAHTHKLHAWESFRINRGEIVPRYYCLTGSFMNYKGSYAQKKKLQPHPPGFYIIELFEKRIRFEKYREADIL